VTSHDLSHSRRHPARIWHRLLRRGHGVTRAGATASTG
jgi:hypothetical protein